MPQQNTDHPRSLYRTCLTGNLPIPRSGARRVVFQTIMVTIMVSCMVTFNWSLREQSISLDSFLGMTYEYPLMFLIALAVRLLIANPIVDRIVPHIPATLTGVRKSLAMTAVNVSIMATIMSIFGTLVSQGFVGFSWLSVAQSIPVSFIAAFVLNFFFVGPLVKVLYLQIPGCALELFESKTAQIGRVASRISSKVLAN